MAPKSTEKDSKTTNPARTRRAVLATGSAVALGGMAGCLGDDDTDDEPELDPDDEPDKPDSITVRAWGGVWEESLLDSIGEPFTAETGIEVTTDNSDIQVAQNDIRSAIDQDREPPVNVNWTIVVFMHSEYRQGLASPLDPEVVPHLDEMQELGQPDVDGDPPYVSLYPYTYALCYNEEALETVQGNSEPVGSWEELWDDQYEDWVGVYNDPPGDGFLPVMAELAGVELGPVDEMDAMWDKLEELEPNIGYLGSDASIAQTLQEQEIAYAAGYLPNNLLGPQDEDVPVDWTIPEEGATVRTDCLYTPKNQSVEELYWSQRFIDFALREDNQRNWMEALQMPMLNENVDPLEWMEGDPAFPTTDAEFDDLLWTDLDVYTEHSSEWFDRFSQVIS